MKAVLNPAKAKRLWRKRGGLLRRRFFNFEGSQDPFQKKKKGGW